jgi:YVTN family beta-propeller protein
VIDTATNTVVAIVNGVNSPEGIAVNSAGTRVYVANNGDNSLSVIDTASNTIVSNVGGLSLPMGVDVTLDDTQVYVVNDGNNTVSVIDTTNNALVNTVTVGNSPVSFGKFIKPEIATFSLTVAKAGTGTGKMSSSPVGIDCGSACSASFNSDQVVTLTATADANSVFSSWTGCDSTPGNQCTVTISADRSVTATFSFILETLTVAISPTGGGSVTSADGFINCPASSCSHTYTAGTAVTLTAIPASGYTFSSWTGCDTALNNQCNLTINANRSVTANFTALFTLQVSISPSGGGSVTSADGFINCPAISCSHGYTSGTGVILSATAASGYTLSSWSGCDSVVNSQCNLTMSANKTVTANFIQQFTLTVAGAGSGNGSVSSSPQGISCAITASRTSGTCSVTVNSGQGITLTASPDASSVFAGWSGCDQVTNGQCNLTMNGPKNVTATFNLQTYALQVGINPAGGGSVTSNDGFINCPGSSCSHTYTSGTAVTLTVSANTGYTFASWSGDCSGTGNCSLTMDRGKSVTANFITAIQRGSGDCNADGQINVIDARIALQKALGFIAIHPPDPCDVNGDGQVTLADAQLIAQYAIGQISGFAMLGVPALALPVFLISFIKRKAIRKWFGRRIFFVLPLLLGVGVLLTSCVSTSPALFFSSNGFSSDPATRYGPTQITLIASNMLDGGLAAISVASGGITFDPHRVQINSITGVNGFTVLASVIDNGAGKVSFAAVNPANGVAQGPIVRFDISITGAGGSPSIEQTTVVQIDPSKLVLGDANNVVIPTSSVGIPAAEFRLFAGP